jgi:signal transduction histidine kinase
MISLDWSERDRRIIYRRGFTIRAVAAGVFAAVFIGIWVCGLGRAIPALPGLLAILVSLVVVNPFLWLIAERRGFPLEDFRVHWMADVAAVTGIVYCLGVLDVPLSVTAYMIMIVSSGTFSSMKMALYLATWSTVCFLGIVAAESAALIPHQHVAFTAHFSPEGRLVMVGASVLLFYVFGYLGGTLAGQLREKAAEVVAQKAELQEAYARQAAASEGKELLSALVQHDLYGPLGAISGACREAVLSCSEGDLQTVERFVLMIEDRLRSVEGAVATLGLLANSGSEETGDGYWLKGLTAELIEDLRAECRERRVNIVTADDESWPLVRLRREEVYHVLRNLVTNSVKAVSDDGSGNVAITVARVGDMCEVLVADNGPGVPDDVAARALQLSSRRLGERRPGGGFGAGLTLSSNLVRSWGGSITYKGREGGGALFAIRIPARWIGEWC